MGTIAEKLNYLMESKTLIENAIKHKGISIDANTPFRELSNKIAQIETGGTGGGGTPVADEWVRPTEWLSLPDNIDGVQKVSILNAVFDTDSEFVAFTCRGAYTVNWGDGVVENYASNVKAEHKYDYTNVNLNSATVTKFGYKQCIITVTPQNSINLTNINLQNFHNSIGGNASYDLTSGFLDIRINASLCTDLVLGASSTSSYVRHTMLEQCLIGELAAIALDNLFYDCYSLQSVTIKDTSNVISFASMHYNNYSLQKMPTYTFRSAGVNVSYMFSVCSSLRETYPLIITPRFGGAYYMFFSCKSLTYIDITIVSDINYSLSSLFQNCSSLEDIKISFSGTGKVTDLGNTFQNTKIKSSPVIDTSLCTTFYYTFTNCDKLTDLYEYDYTSATTLTNMLNGCHSLKSIPNFNITNKCTNLNSLCSNCSSLEKAPTFSDSSGVTNADSMLSACKSLTTIPNYIFGNTAVISVHQFVNGCDSLQIMPNITVGPSNLYILNSCYSLKRMLMPLRVTFSVANAKMSANALNEMFSILPIVTGQTVTITGNYGASTCDKTIATSKGWTVVA